MENVRKYRDMKLVTADKRRNQLESEPNYHTTKNFSENLMAIDMKKTKVKMNKAAYLGMSMLDISKTCMNFRMITLNQNINGVALNTEQNCATWSLTALLFISKPKILMKTLLLVLKMVRHLILIIKKLKEQKSV